MRCSSVPAPPGHAWPDQASPWWLVATATVQAWLACTPAIESPSLCQRGLVEGGTSSRESSLSSDSPAAHRRHGSMVQEGKARHASHTVCLRCQAADPSAVLPARPHPPYKRFHSSLAFKIALALILIQISRSSHAARLGASGPWEVGSRWRLRQSAPVHFELPGNRRAPRPAPARARAAACCRSAGARSIKSECCFPVPAPAFFPLCCRLPTRGRARPATVVTRIGTTVGQRPGGGYE